MFSALFFAVLVNLKWVAPVSGPAPEGYKIVIGDTSGTKTQVIDAGNTLSKQIDIGDLSKVKYIAVKSYNQWGDSVESNEVVVGKPQAPASLTASGQ